jgi:hypothetical protein
MSDSVSRVRRNFRLEKRQGNAVVLDEGMPQRLRLTTLLRGPEEPDCAEMLSVNHRLRSRSAPERSVKLK